MRRLLFPVMLLATALLATGCGSGRSANYDEVYIQELEAQVADQKAIIAQKDAEIASLQSQLASRPTATDNLTDLRRDLSGTGAEAEWRDGELVISITNDILFASGSATLTAGAKGSLRTVAETIRSRYPGQFVRIEGHTDNQPIRRTRNKWEDNWDLAGGRARAVLHELIERGGLEQSKVSFAGYSDTRPRSDNNSNDGRSRNRRVEIVVLPAQRP